MVKAQKKLYWYSGGITNGADQQWDYNLGANLVENTYGLDMTVQNISGYVDFIPGAQDKAYYVMIGVTDGAGSYPFDSSSMTAAITTDAELRDWLEKNKKSIWMTMGGIIKASVDEGPAHRVEFDAASKRTLMKGQNVIIVVMTKNLHVSTADTSYVAIDMTAFYSG